MVKQPTAEYPRYFFERVTKSWRRRYIAGVRRRQPFSSEAASSRGRQQVPGGGSKVFCQHLPAQVAIRGLRLARRHLPILILVR
jgi:hypothetical protein